MNTLSLSANSLYPNELLERGVAGVWGVSLEAACKGAPL
jgi:hypothetical protein